MNKLTQIFKNTNSFRRLDLNFKKKVLFFDKELDKFTIKEVNLRDYLKNGKSLMLSPYPCKLFYLNFENSRKETKL